MAYSIVLRVADAECGEATSTEMGSGNNGMAVAVGVPEYAIVEEKGSVEVADAACNAGVHMVSLVWQALLVSPAVEMARERAQVRAMA